LKQLRQKESLKLAAKLLFSMIMQLNWRFINLKKSLDVLKLKNLKTLQFVIPKRNNFVYFYNKHQK
jgi:hypothetical protein